MLEVNNTVTTELNIKTFEGEKVARSYKINIELQKQFKAFCKAHSEYEVGDILANAMLEFMNKYKKVLCMECFFLLDTFYRVPAD